MDVQIWGKRNEYVNLMITKAKFLIDERMNVKNE